ncbi:MAG TPA: hypothetical protein VGG97_03705 [Bryobacteraceae bacterium]|jgi:hypothetical protein
MREFVVRIRLFFDLLLAVPFFAMLIFIDPESYARTLGDSEKSIRLRIVKYRKRT